MVGIKEEWMCAVELKWNGTALRQERSASPAFSCTRRTKTAAADVSGAATATIKIAQNNPIEFQLMSAIIDGVNTLCLMAVTRRQRNKQITRT